jgi:hypothetical protein
MGLELILCLVGLGALVFQIAFLEQLFFMRGVVVGVPTIIQVVWVEMVVVV